MADQRRPKGILFDTLFSQGFPQENRLAIITRFQALFASELGKQVLADLDAIITPSVFPYEELGNGDSRGALIAHEAQRNFWTQMKAIRDHNVRSEPKPRQARTNSGE